MSENIESKVVVSEETGAEIKDDKNINASEVLSEEAKKKEAKRQEKLLAKAAKKEKKSKKKDSEKTDSEKAVSEEAATLEVDEDGNPVEKKRRRKKSAKVKKKPEDVNIVKELLSLIVYIGIVVLVCYLIINFVGCRSRVDGSSMEPTLSDADNLWVDKLSYTFGDPDRFDVIIFNYDEDTTYVKRIIGLPGETVRIDQSGNIYINDKLLKENYGSEVILPTSLGRASQPVLLGEDEYFVLGDNRNNSSDSRWADVGNVNMEDIVGKVVLRIYPFTSFGIIK